MINIISNMTIYVHVNIFISDFECPILIKKSTVIPSFH